MSEDWYSIKDINVAMLDVCDFVLLYIKEPDFPFLPVTASNKEYLKCGNAEKAGYSYWCPMFYPEVREDEVSQVN